MMRYLFQKCPRLHIHVLVRPHLHPRHLHASDLTACHLPGAAPLSVILPRLGSALLPAAAALRTAAPLLSAPALLTAPAFLPRTYSREKQQHRQYHHHKVKSPHISVPHKFESLPRGLPRPALNRLSFRQSKAGCGLYLEPAQ
jgi:hypothetical protein